MAKKKITIKKSPARVKKPKETTEEKAMRMAQDLASLVYHPGWAVLKEINENNIDFLDQQIIKKMDQNGKPLTEMQCDELRVKRDYLEELLETPLNFINKLKKDGQIADDFDPYFKTMSEMKRSALNPES